MAAILVRLFCDANNDVKKPFTVTMFSFVFTRLECVGVTTTLQLIYWSSTTNKPANDAPDLRQKLTDDGELSLSSLYVRLRLVSCRTTHKYVVHLVVVVSRFHALAQTHEEITN